MKKHDKEFITICIAVVFIAVIVVFGLASEFNKKDVIEKYTDEEFKVELVENSGLEGQYVEYLASIDYIIMISSANNVELITANVGDIIERNELFLEDVARFKVGHEQLMTDEQKEIVDTLTKSVLSYNKAVETLHKGIVIKDEGLVYDSGILFGKAVTDIQKYKEFVGEE